VLKPALLASAVAVLLPHALQAQRGCPVSSQVGWIGITGIECSNCTIAAPGNGRSSRFSTEPTITDIASGSPAAGQLEPGDVLVSVNGSLITTTEGALKFSNLKPGQSLVVIIRRDGEQLLKRFQFLPGKCPNDPNLLGSGAPAGEAPGVAPSAGFAPGEPPRATPPALPSRPTARGFDAVPPSSVLTQPRASFGFGIVVWEFASPPEVYSVETSGPAYRAGLRRGDLITHIDGHPITRDEAGRRFATAEPGQLLRFTYRRGSQTRTVSVRAEPRVAVRDSREATNALRRARQLVEEMYKRQRSEHAQLSRELARFRDEQLTTARETLSRYLREQTAQQNRLTELQEQLSEAEVRLSRVPTATVRPPRAAATGFSVSPNSSRVIRYSGRLDNTDVEVRGGANVIVNETADEIVITAGDATIRIKKRDLR
jgi:hypothetical protein